MNQSSKKPNLFRKKKIVRFFIDRKKIFIERSYFLGSKMSKFFINLGYLVATSAFFKKNKDVFNSSKKSLYNYLASDYQLGEIEMTYLEFGVYKGSTFEYWLHQNSNPNSIFTGFDTFSGLPEDWGHIPKGHFDTRGNMPHFDDQRYQFKKGLFSESLPPFILSNQDLLKKKLVIHLDADLYSSTLFVLVSLSSYIKQGDVLIFDEFFSVLNASTEFRAFMDFLTINPLKYKVIGTTTEQCAILIE